MTAKMGQNIPMSEQPTPRRPRRRLQANSQEASWGAFLQNYLATRDRGTVDSFLAGLASLGTHRAA